MLKLLIKILFDQFILIIDSNCIVVDYLKLISKLHCFLTFEIHAGLFDHFFRNLRIDKERVDIVMFAIQMERILIVHSSLTSI